jgi:glycosyltransferase involved in cell wall biosynthesis
MKPRLIYALHSGNLYGTERMALYTAGGLLDDFDPVIMAPPGPALQEAAKLGFEAVPFESALQFAGQLRKQLSLSGKKVAFLATGVMHSAVCLALNKLYRRRIAHLHLVHGGAAESLSYGRKGKLNGQPVEFVAVSNYVRERLIANGVNPAQVRVIENFLPDTLARGCAHRQSFHGEQLNRLIVISRLDPEKRVDLLLEALETAPDGASFEIEVYGTGWNTDQLKARAEKAGLKVAFQGFSSRVREALAASDILVHLCPVEPFGLAIIEAMAAGVPALVPDAGGAGSLVEDNVSGFKFHANDANALITKIREITSQPPEILNGIVTKGHELLDTRFSQTERINDYRKLLLESLA